MGKGIAGALPQVAVAEQLAQAIAGLVHRPVPDDVRETAERLLIDVAGLCLVARNTDYVGRAGDARVEQAASQASSHLSRQDEPTKLMMIERRSPRIGLWPTPCQVSAPGMKITPRLRP